MLGQAAVAFRRFEEHLGCGKFDSDCESKGRWFKLGGLRSIGGEGPGI